MDFLLNDGNIQMIVGLAGTALLGLLGKLIQSTWARKAADKLLDAALPIVYNLVEEAARKSPNKIDDKLALALKYLVDFFATHGLEPTDKQLDRAKLVLTAMHAESKAQEKQ